MEAGKGGKDSAGFLYLQRNSFLNYHHPSLAVPIAGEPLRPVMSLIY